MRPRQGRADALSPDCAIADRRGTVRISIPVMLNCPALHNDFLPQRLADCAHFSSNVPRYNAGWQCRCALTEINAQIGD
ncbi:hypothetical protein [Erwinia amylovora]|uniref:hypothetical protein n=1 Tax=Erwinia amylovora TaxID=552 RepID=UPI0014445AC7|nr:hypothetical protein [Erwinia amylovora]